ncbi:3-deoxy-7-phosphoheptulonate synthase [Sorangium sp. So ce429]
MVATIFDSHDEAPRPRHPEPSWLDCPAEQQARYSSETQHQRMLALISQAPTLVPAGSAAGLQALIARAAEGQAFILQMGDCAEAISDANSTAVARKIAFLNAAADVLTTGLGKSTIKIGRIGGQYAKPRSQLFETKDGVTLPCFRGESINGYEFSSMARAANPLRLRSAYLAAQKTHALIRSYNRTHGPNPVIEHIFTSHEALHLSFEDALSRTDDAHGRFNGAGHLIWIGARTNHPDHAHVSYCAGLANPIAVKISPAISAADIQKIHHRLNPRNKKGRLILISRMGRDKVAACLPPLLDALDAIGAEASWMCDPMHGNTFSAPSGIKTRALSDIRSELGDTIDALARAGRALVGVHLETSPDDIAECVLSRDSEDELQRLGARFRSKCDPRLNRAQTLELCRWLTERLNAAARNNQ